LGLDPQDGVEDDHPLRDLGRVVVEGAARSIPAPDPERGSLRHHFISSMIAFSSAGIGGLGTRSTRMSPPPSLRTTRLNVPDAGSFSGKSSRKCAPRLSLRSRADRVTASETARRF